MTCSEAEPRLGGENRASGCGPILLALCLAAGAGYGQWVEDSIDVGGRWVGSLVYNSRADVVYGRSGSGDLFFAISCDSNKVIAQLELNNPGYLAYSTISNKAYCVFRDGGDSIAVVDGSTHTRLRAIAVEGASKPVWDATTNRLYVSCSDRYVRVIDCVTDSVLCRIPVGSGPGGPDINDRYRKLYVRNRDGESISIIDLESLEVIETIRLDGVPMAGCYSTAVDKYYCGCGESNEVVVIDGVGDTVVAAIALPQGASVPSMSCSNWDSLVMVGTYSVATNTVFGIDALGDSVVSALPVNGDPWSLTWSPATNLAYCANYDDIVTVIAGDGTRVLKTIPVGDAPFVFAHVPVHHRLYLGHLNSNMVYVIRDTTSGIEEGGHIAVPLVSVRVQPNPFHGCVSVEYTGSSRAGGIVSVYSHAGRLVARLKPERISHHGSRFTWDGLDSGGCEVPAGVYVLVGDGSGAGRVNVVKCR